MRGGSEELRRSAAAAGLPACVGAEGAGVVRLALAGGETGLFLAILETAEGVNNVEAICAASSHATVVPRVTIPAGNCPESEYL